MPHEAYQLVNTLEEKGLQPADIGIVINTHFHVDHVSNNSLFPNSQIYASQESYDWCRSLYSDILSEARWEKLVLNYYPETFEYEQAREYMAKLRKFALRWWDVRRLGSGSQFRWMETQTLPEGMESVVTWGHVPGHASLVVHAGEQTIVIAGDALLTRNQEQQVLTMIPHNREQFRRDRTQILSLGRRILPGHDREFSTIDTAGTEPEIR